MSNTNLAPDDISRADLSLGEKLDILMKRIMAEPPTEKTMDFYRALCNAATPLLKSESKDIRQAAWKFLDIYDDGTTKEFWDWLTIGIENKL